MRWDHLVEFVGVDMELGPLEFLRKVSEGGSLDNDLGEGEGCEEEEEDRL